MKTHRAGLFMALFIATCQMAGAEEKPFIDDEAEVGQPHGILTPQAEWKPENTAYCALPDFQMIDFESEDTGIVLSGRLLRAGSKTVAVDVKGKALTLDMEDLTEDSRRMVRRFQVRGKVEPLPLEYGQSDVLDAKGLKSYRYIRTPGKQVDFLLYAPKGAPASGREIPLILYFHGKGGSGKDNFKTLTDGGGAVLHLVGEDFQKFMPCYVLIPQSHNVDDAWETWSAVGGYQPLAEAVRAIDTLKAGIAPDIDMRRLYLTGLSVGGMACFDALSVFPGKFAAAVPIAGDVGYEQFAPWNARPVWMVFNKGDAQMCLEDVEHLKKRFAALKCEFKVTELPGQMHDAWNATYRNPDFRRWLQRQKLNSVSYPSDWRDPAGS